MWKKHHPDWEYRLWTDEDNRNYIKTNYPEYLEIYDGYEYNIQRADIIRYFILKDFGGVYSDLDLYPVENIEKYINGENDCYFVFSGNSSNYFTNSFMASNKNCKVWIDVLKELKNPLPWYAIGKHLTVMMSTGPMMVDRVIKNCNYVIGLLPKNRFMSYKVGDDYNHVKEDVLLMPLEGQSWNEWDSYILNLLNQNKIFFISLGLLFIVIILGLLFYYIGKSKVFTYIIKF
jgi:mannosyltransferase OCH1-like enzyme